MAGPETPSLCPSLEAVQRCDANRILPLSFDRLPLLSARRFGVAARDESGADTCWTTDGGSQIDSVALHVPLTVAGGIIGFVMHGTSAELQQ